MVNKDILLVNGKYVDISISIHTRCSDGLYHAEVWLDSCTSKQFENKEAGALINSIASYVDDYTKANVATNKCVNCIVGHWECKGDYIEVFSNNPDKYLSYDTFAYCPVCGSANE